MEQLDVDDYIDKYLIKFDELVRLVRSNFQSGCCSDLSVVPSTSSSLEPRLNVAE